MFTSHFNELTEDQHERLSLLLEETGEVQQIIGKILRHGYESTHPDRQGVTNREDLQKELGHVIYAVRLLSQWHDVDFARIMALSFVKAKTVKQYLHHQPK